MTMPLRLLFVRHGMSWANAAQKDDDVAELLKDTPDSEIRLTPKGIEQAISAGNWLREYLAGSKPFGYVSPFVRACQTAANLGLGIEWRPHPFLIERDWGEYGNLPAEEKRKHTERKRRDPLYARMPNGQAFNDLCVSNHSFFGTLHREHSEDTVVAVCHGERMLVLRYHLERMLGSEFRALRSSRRVGDQVRNCQIFEYTRVNPEDGEVAPYLRWFRSFCPWDLRPKDLKWKEFVHKKLSDADLLAEVEQIPMHPVPEIF